MTSSTLARSHEQLDHTDRFVDCHGDTVQGGFLNRTAIFIRPGSVCEQTLDRGVDLFLSGFPCLASHSYDAIHKLSITGIQVFGDEIQDLRPVVAMAHGPTWFSQVGGVGCFYCITDVFTVTITHLANYFAFLI